MSNVDTKSAPWVDATSLRICNACNGRSAGLVERPTVTTPIDGIGLLLRLKWTIDDTLSLLTVLQPHTRIDNVMFAAPMYWTMIDRVRTAVRTQMVERRVDSLQVSLRAYMQDLGASHFRRR